MKTPEQIAEKMLYSVPNPDNVRTRRWIKVQMIKAIEEDRKQVADELALLRAEVRYLTTGEED